MKMMTMGLMALGAACPVGGSAPVADVLPECPAGEIVVVGNVSTPCNASGTYNTITVTWPVDAAYDDPTARSLCDDMGGTFVLRWVDGVPTAECRNVNF